MGSVAIGSSSSVGVEASEITVFERDGGTLFGFSDPDGNTWAVQQLKASGGSRSSRRRAGAVTARAEATARIAA